MTIDQQPIKTHLKPRQYLFKLFTPFTRGPATLLTLSALFLYFLSLIAGSFKPLGINDSGDDSSLAWVVAKGKHHSLWANCGVDMEVLEVGGVDEEVLEVGGVDEEVDGGEDEGEIEVEGIENEEDSIDDENFLVNDTKLTEEEKKEMDGELENEDDKEKNGKDELDVEDEKEKLVSEKEKGENLKKVVEDEEDLEEELTDDKKNAIEAAEEESNEETEEVYDSKVQNTKLKKRDNIQKRLFKRPDPTAIIKRISKRENTLLLKKEEIDCDTIYEEIKWSSVESIFLNSNQRVFTTILHITTYILLFLSFFYGYRERYNVAYVLTKVGTLTGIFGFSLGVYTFNQVIENGRSVGDLSIRWGGGAHISFWGFVCCSISCLLWRKTAMYRETEKGVYGKVPIFGIDDEGMV